MNESLDPPQAADRLAPKRPDPTAPATAAPDVISVGAAHSHDAGATAGKAATSGAGSRFHTCYPPIMLPMFLAVADQTIVSTVLPAIASDLGEIERASWVVDSYL